MISSQMFVKNIIQNIGTNMVFNTYLLAVHGVISECVRMSPNCLRGAAGSCQELPGLAGNCRELAGSCRELPGAPGSRREPPEAAGNRLELPGAAGSLPGVAGSRQTPFPRRPFCEAHHWSFPVEAINLDLKGPIEIKGPCEMARSGMAKRAISHASGH